jgi:hypothetical protein
MYGVQLDSGLYYGWDKTIGFNCKKLPNKIPSKNKEEISELQEPMGRREPVSLGPRLSGGAVAVRGEQIH